MAMNQTRYYQRWLLVPNRVKGYWGAYFVQSSKDRVNILFYLQGDVRKKAMKQTKYYQTWWLVTIRVHTDTEHFSAGAAVHI